MEEIVIPLFFRDVMNNFGSLNYQVALMDRMIDILKDKQSGLSEELDSIRDDLRSLTSRVQQLEKKEKHQVVERPRASPAAAAVAIKLPISSTPSTPPLPGKGLLRAAEDGDAEELLRLLEAGADVRQRNGQGDSAIHLAAERGHSVALVVLMARGAVWNDSGKNCSTPLHRAASRGHELAIRCLLWAGALVNIKDIDGNTALNLAANERHWNIVQLLLKRGATVEFVEGKNDSPLRQAVEAGQVKVVREFLKKRVSLSKKELWQSLALVTDQDVIQVFNEILPGFVRGKPGENAMLQAANKGRCDSLVELLNAGVNINATNINGSALHYACFAGRIDCIKILLTRGARIDLKDNKGCTPLHVAVMQGKEDCVHLLVREGANKRIKNNSGKTPRDLAKTTSLRKIFHNDKDIYLH